MIHLQLCSKGQTIASVQLKVTDLADGTSLWPRSEIYRNDAKFQLSFRRSSEKSCGRVYRPDATWRWNAMGRPRQFRRAGRVFQNRGQIYHVSRPAAGSHTPS